MKNTLLLLFIVFFISCTSNQVSEDNINQNEIRVLHSGDRLGPQTVIFNEVEVTTIMEQNSANQEVEVLNITAFSGSGTNQYINFKVYPNSVGEDVLFEDFFCYKFDRNNLTVTYLNFNESISLNVLTNNESEFTATFSGKLRHFEQVLQSFIILNLNGGTISIKY